MKGISIRLPYIQQIILGKKKYENRNWTTPYRGDLVLCSSLTVDACEDCFLPRGCLLAVATLEDVVENKAGEYRYGWQLNNIRPLLPKRFSGKLRFFEVPNSQIIFLKQR